MHASTRVREKRRVCVCVDLREKPPAKKKGGGKGGETTTTTATAAAAAAAAATTTTTTTTTNPEGKKEGRREGPNRLVSTGLHVVERVSEHRSSVQ